MCGIIGILSRNKSPHRDLTPALRMLKHRGPDDYGIFYDKHIHMGHTRLAILDLSSLGHQPMSYHGGRYVITFNGEIYNYLELREVLEGLGHVFISRSDTEVLLAAYAQWGKDCLKKLRACLPSLSGILLKEGYSWLVIVLEKNPFTTFFVIILSICFRVKNPHLYTAF